MKKVNIVLLISSLLIFIGLMDMSRDYYQVLKWVVFIVTIFSAYLAYAQKQIGWLVAFVVVAVFFNPIFPPRFHKDTWRIVDTLSGLVCLISSFMIKLK